MSNVLPSSELFSLSTEQQLTPLEMERLVTNAAMASFAPYDDRRRLVSDVIAPGFAALAL